MKQQKRKIIGAAIILCVLVLSYFWSGHFSTDPLPTADEPANITSPVPSSEDIPQDPASAQETAAPAATNGTDSKTVQTDSALASSAPSKGKEMKIDPETGKDPYLTEPVPEGKPTPAEPQNTQVEKVSYTCTLSVRCDTIFKNINRLNPEKAELIPNDGILFSSAEVTFHEGESAFNVLQRELKKQKIHLEFKNTPMYNSAYIEGIGNIYEFDCGELSGWMYRVNGWFPNYGSSRYQLKDGDVIEWLYTCDLGKDIGGSNVSQGGR